MNQEHILVEHRRCTSIEVQVPVLASYRQPPAEGAGDEMPQGLLAGELTHLQAPWRSGELLPSKHGSCLRQSCCCLFWINNLNYRGAVGQNFPALTVLRLFNLLFSRMISEPGGISRRGDLLPSCSLFPCERLERLVGWGAASRAGTSGRCFCPSQV